MNNDKRDKSAILSLFITILSAILTPIIQIASNFAIKTDNRPFIHSMKDKAKSIITACAGLMLAANASAVTSPVDYVNTLMGTDSKISLSNGNTVPSVALPWGMNQWIPQTGKMGDGWAYVYNSDKIRGFKQTHRPSPWINDFGQFSLMPVTGGIRIDEARRASWFSHKAEDARPYYYSVYLADYDVTTEFTPTDRCAYFQFTFPEGKDNYVIVDGYDRGSWIKVIPEENTVVGYSTRNSGGVTKNFRNYFVIKFDKPFDSNWVWEENELQPGKTELRGNHTGAAIGFNTARKEKVGAKVATSFISLEQAYQNLKELDGKSFAQTRDEAKARWNEVLGAVNIEDDNIDDLRTFYSCLYRTVLFPHKLHEVTADGRTVHYSPDNGKIEDGYFYTGTGFWDTFRALFPLVNLLWPEEGAKIQDGWLSFYRESGFFPEWSSPGHRGCMVGNNSASVVADAMLKGIGTPGNEEEYFAGMVHGANNVHPRVASSGRMGHEYYNSLGYVPYDVNINENAARTLEYAYDDWCIYQVAKKLGRPADEIALYKKRAGNYANLFDPETGLMRGKNKDGRFAPNFNPLKWGDAFTEGNSWHYSWSVFHDVQGLINLMGGNKKFTAQLDKVFELPPVFDDSYYGGTIHEIREMQIADMGNYAHGNQPIQHMIYLYNYAAEPWKAQYWSRQTIDKLYHPTPDGYCGDEDNGQTSAWYVFSALGFYPVCPASDQYVLGAPIFKKATVNLQNGKKVEITADKPSSENCYVKSMRVNGKNYNHNYLDYATLTKGAKINFNMSDTPNTSRGIRPEDAPYSLTNEN